MRRTVFAEPDRIVSEDEQRAHAHQRRHAQGVAAIVREREERAAVGNESSVQREPVHDRGHAELAHAVVADSCRRSSPSTAREPDHSVRLEPARSAEPPISSGRIGARPSMTSCDALRVAMFAAFARVLIRQLRARARRNPPAARRACVARVRGPLADTHARTRKVVRFQESSSSHALAARIPQLIHVRRNLERRVVPLDGGSRRRDLLARRAARRAHRACPPCWASLSR